jgi:hypothetical protein
LLLYCDFTHAPLPSRAFDIGTTRLMAVPGESCTPLDARRWCTGSARRALAGSIDLSAPDAAGKVSDSRWLS